jgi:hypothetical protein
MPGREYYTDTMFISDISSGSNVDIPNSNRKALLIIANGTVIVRLRDEDGNIFSQKILLADGDVVIEPYDETKIKNVSAQGSSIKLYELF